MPGADQVALGMGLVDGNVGIAASGQFHLGAAGGIGRAGAALEHSGPGEQLRAVADGGHGFVGVEEVTYGRAHAFIATQIPGPRPPGMTRASYCSGFTSANVALSVKLWPGFSL